MFKKLKAKEEFKVGKHGIIYVDNSFLTEFGEEEFEIGSVLKSQKLSRSMNDSEIISELKVQECTLGDVLSTMMQAEGDMKDGNSNIFYIKGHSRVVGVGWSSGSGGWGVGDWHRGFGSWYGGRRVFSGSFVEQKPKDTCECPRCESCGKRIIK